VWISKATFFQLTEKARFEGMGEAADSLIRSMSPYFEGDDGSIPGPVVKAMAAMEHALTKSKDFYEIANAYQVALLTLGKAIGEACEAKMKLRH